MKSKVSIVIPVYNCMEYIDGCMESVLNQTYSEFEVILVDDGSTDESGDKCDYYAQRDERVRVIHKKNQGVSNARNTGVMKAEGEYLLFVDSDDCIDERMIESLVLFSELNDTDIAICGMYDIYANGKKRFPVREVDCVMSGKDAVREMLISNIITGYVWGKLIRKKLVQECVFPEDITIGEDAIVVSKILYKAERVGVFSQPLYNYIHRDMSLMTSDFSEKNMDLIRAYKRIAVWCEENELDMKEETDFRVFWSYFRVLDKIMLSKSANAMTQKAIASYLFNHAGEILKNKFISKKRKITLLGLMIHPNIYRKIIKCKIVG